MKNSLNNNTRFLRTAVFAMMTLLVTTANLSALESKPAHYSDSLTVEKATTVEEALMIEDLLNSLEEAEDLAVLESGGTSMVEVYDSNDELLLSVTEVKWNAQQAIEIVSMNRNAEFLFEMNGTSIYKVF